LPAQAAAMPAAVRTGNPKMLQSHLAAIFSASACKHPASSRRPLRQSASVILRTACHVPNPRLVPGLGRNRIAAAQAFAARSISMGIECTRPRGSSRPCRRAS
jgi:hypothetical protein